jgi:large subunit ribosomal protein L25
MYSFSYFKKKFVYLNKTLIFAPPFSGNGILLTTFSEIFKHNTMEVVKLTGSPRVGIGKKATKADRASEAIPCVLYGGNDNVHFTTTWGDVRHLIYTPDFKLAELTVGSTTTKAILKDVQFHPATEKILHIDFLALTPGQAVKVNIPLRLKGTSPGVKAGGKLIQNVRKIKVKCMPEAIVDELFLDISGLDLGQTARVREIIAQKGIEIMMSPSIPVVLIEIPRALRSAAAAEAKASGKK